MISDEDLEQLRFKGEGADLDFKQAQYHFVGAPDHQKSELLKDIMAMANAYRSGAGYILIGFKDLAPHPAEVVGLSASDHIDDAAIQQFVRSKIEPLLEFQYEERLFDGKHIAVITIPKQVRPFAPRQDFGVLKRNVALVRRGSSTDEASLSEMTKMALADAGTSKDARVDLRIDTKDNQPLPARLALRFLRFEKLPDYKVDRRVDMGNGILLPMHTLRIANRDYYREGAEYHAVLDRLVLVRLSLANRSDFALGEVKLELTCLAPPSEDVRMLRADHLPDEPEPEFDPVSSSRFRGLAERHRETVTADDRGSEPVCNAFLGTLRPGETGGTEIDVALLPSGPGCYTLRVRILARELAVPILKEHALTIEGEIKQMKLVDLAQLMFGSGGPR